MSEYFRFVGVIGLLLFIIGTIVDIVYISSIVRSAAQYGGGASFVQLLPSIVFLIAFIFFGPALSLLFISHADIMDHAVIGDESDEKAADDSSCSKVAILGATLMINGKMHPFKNITDASVSKNIITIVYDGKFVEIRCEDNRQAETLYNQIYLKMWVEFYPGSKLYNYLCTKDDVNIGDTLTLKSQGDNKKVIVKNIKKVYEDELPLPLNKMAVAK